MKIFILAFFFFCTLKCLAQNQIIDSLKNELQIQHDDTNKVQTNLELCTAYNRLGNSTEILSYADSALTLSRKISFKKGEANAHFYKALAYYNLNDIQSAVKNDSASLEIFKEINYEPGIIKAYYSLGIVCEYTDSWPDAIKNMYQALELFEKSGRKTEVANGLQVIGFIYYVHNNYTESYKAFSNALSIYKSLGTDKNTSGCYIFIANIYTAQKKYSEAWHYDSIGLRLSIQEQNDQMIGNAYSAAGDIIAANGGPNDISEGIISTEKLTEALVFYQKALKCFQSVLDSGGIGDTYQRLAEVNTRLKRFKEAQKYADSTMYVAKRLQYKDNLANGYLVQARLDSATGNFQNAFTTYKKFVEYRDSMMNQEYLSKLEREQAQYEFDKQSAFAKAEQDKKDADARRTKNQQYFIIAVMGIVVLAGIVIAVIQYRNNRHKQEANTLLQHQKEKVESTLSELKSTQAQLIQSEKMASLGELTAGIAHEIQNPLNFVNNFSDVNKEMIVELKEEIDKGNYDEAKLIANNIEENSEKINHHGKRADAIVKGMLQHSRASSGQKQPTDINALCDEYLRLAYHGLRAKDKSFNAELKTDFDPVIEKINIVPQDIGRVLLNLINNAFYAVSEKKKSCELSAISYEPLVSVQTRKLNGKIEISVKDNGNGIPDSIKEKIFQPFFTTKPTGSGTGLGLSLSYDIVKAHGGEIKVETKKGEGSIFKILLPINNA